MYIYIYLYIYIARVRICTRERYCSSCLGLLLNVQIAVHTLATATVCLLVLDESHKSQISDSQLSNVIVLHLQLI